MADVTAEVSGEAAPVQDAARRTGAAIIRSSLLSMLAIAALGITRLVHLAIVERSVPKGDERWAVLVVLIGVTMTAGLFLPGGLASAAGKFIPYHLGRGDEAAAGGVYKLISLAGYAAAAFLGIVVAALASVAYGVGGADAFAAGLLTFVFSGYSVEKAALYGFHRIDGYVRLELAGSALAILSTIVVVVLGWGAFLLPLTLGYTVLIAGSWVLLRRRGPGSAGRMSAVPGGEKREILGFVTLASMGGLASAGLLQALPAIADSFTGAEEVTYFAYAVSLVGPLYFLPRALGLALFPAMAHAHGAGDVASVRKQADLTTRALFVMLAPLFAVAIVLSRQILGVPFGREAAAGAVALQVLLAATFFMVTQVASVNALSSGTAREVRIPVTSSVIGGAAGVAAAIPLGLWLGAAGVGVGYLIAGVISAFGVHTAVARRHGLDWRKPVAKAVAVVAAAIVLWRLLELLPVAAGWQWIIDVAGALAAGLFGVLVLRSDIRHILSAAPKRQRQASEVEP